MPKIFIKFRKKFILPIKWYFRRRQDAGSIIAPSNEELLLKYENIKDELLIAERTNDYVGIKIANSRLRLINWIMGKQ